jgi:hypothetical protein
MRPTPEQLVFKRKIAGSICSNVTKDHLVNLFEASIEIELNRVLKIVRDGVDMDERGNASLCEHLEWAIKGGDDD